MDGMTLLTQAQAAGLTVEADGNRLVLRGPKSAEELAQRLLRNKAEVMAALDNAPAVDGPESPAASETDFSAADGTLAASRFANWARPPCPTCGGVLWWEDLEGGRHCLNCERAKFEQSRELARLAHRLRAASGLPLRGAEVEAKPPTPGELRCDRCKSTQLVEATTHGGRTVRLDCARCGRFVAWKTWYGKLLVQNGN
jgi:hypothetical protein